jgi:hypothetical protein
MGFGHFHSGFETAHSAKLIILTTPLREAGAGEQSDRFFRGLKHLLSRFLINLRSALGARDPYFCASARQFKFHPELDAELDLGGNSSRLQARTS